jgi:hypothetical protein
LAGKPAGVGAHAALVLKHRQRVRLASRPGWHWFYECANCGAQVRCTSEWSIAGESEAQPAEPAPEAVSALQQFGSAEPSSIGLNASRPSAPTLAGKDKPRPRIPLPSGRIVQLPRTNDPRRPWEPYESSGMYTLRRERLGNSGTYDFFKSGNTRPTVMDKVDAEALASVLNVGRKRDSV